MSRIGKLPIVIPAGVTVEAQDNVVTVKGKLGELSRTLQRGITVAVEDNQVVVNRTNNSRILRSCHGLSRTLIANMIIGVTEGYKRGLNIDGTGFKAAVQGNKVVLSLGYPSPKEYEIPEGVSVTVDGPGVNLVVEGTSKELVGNTAARIRSYYPAEPYKGKGIKYADEQIRRKQGKTVA